MALNGVVAAAPSGALGFDIDSPLTAAGAAGYRARGFAFCVRYLTRSAAKEQAGDLTAAEGAAILAGGLALMAVQHVAKAGWAPSLALGQTYGANAAKNAAAVGLLPTTCVWLDLEGVTAAAAPADVIAYCNVWHDAVAGAGFTPGLYVGANPGLDSDDLYFRLKMSHYWRSGSTVPDVAHRGYQLFQAINPGDIDRNVARTDAFGGAALWIQAA